MSPSTPPGISSSTRALPTDGSADGRHVVTLQATDNAGNVSSPATVSFVLDTTPPKLIQTLPGPLPGSAGLTDTNPTIAGVVTDAIAGVQQLQARIDGGPYFNVPFDAQGNYSFTPQLPLDGSADGPHAIFYRAVDKLGNSFNDLPGPTFTLDCCGFANGLAGWTTDQTGGTNTGKGTVTLDTSGKENSVVLREGDSFQVALERTFVIPAGATSLSFTYANLSFDTSSVGTIKDAFEASLVDSSGQSLVHTIGAGRDAFFNITEGQSAALGSEATLTGQTVTLDLSGVFAGTTATLVIRLVNNDTDHNTSVAITCVRSPDRCCGCSANQPKHFRTAHRGHGGATDPGRCRVTGFRPRGIRKLRQSARSHSGSPRRRHNLPGRVDDPSDRAASAPVTLNGTPVEAMDAAGDFFTRVVVNPGINVLTFASSMNNGPTSTVTLTLEGVQPTPGTIDFTNFSDVSASFTGDYARTSFNEDTKILYADLRVRNAGSYPADAPLIVGVKNIS